MYRKHEHKVTVEMLNSKGNKRPVPISLARMGESESQSQRSSPRSSSSSRVSSREEPKKSTRHPSKLMEDYRATFKTSTKLLEDEANSRPKNRPYLRPYEDVRANSRLFEEKESFSSRTWENRPFSGVPLSSSTSTSTLVSKYFCNKNYFKNWNWFF